MRSELSSDFDPKKQFTSNSITRLGAEKLEIWEPLVSQRWQLGNIDSPIIRETLELTHWGNVGFRSLRRKSEFPNRQLWKLFRIWPVRFQSPGQNSKSFSTTVNKRSWVGVTQKSFAFLVPSYLGDCVEPFSSLCLLVHCTSFDSLGHQA